MPPELSLALRVVDLVGVVLNGVIGGTIARKRRFDAVGFVTLAIISALGGGIVRDLLLAAGRPVAVEDPSYLIGAMSGAAVAYFLNLRGNAWRLFFMVADAIVLGAWAANGTAKALQYGVAWLPAICMGMATAVGGGMIRDVTAGRPPQVFGGNNLYAIPALVSALAVLGGDAARLPAALCLILATALGAGLAIAAGCLGGGCPCTATAPTRARANAWPADGEPGVQAAPRGRTRTSEAKVRPASDRRPGRPSPPRAWARRRRVG